MVSFDTDVVFVGVVQALGALWDVLCIFGPRRAFGDSLGNPRECFGGAPEHYDGSWGTFGALGPWDYFGHFGHRAGNTPGFLKQSWKHFRNLYFLAAFISWVTRRHHTTQHLFSQFYESKHWPLLWTLWGQETLLVNTEVVSVILIVIREAF